VQHTRVRSLPCTVELPDEFYEATLRDVAAAHNSIVRRQQEREILFDVEVLRQSRVRESYLQYIIRVRFPDGVELQSIFSKIDTIDAVMQVIRSCLIDPKLPFYLCTSDAR